MGRSRIKAFYVKGCKLTPKRIFNGYVLNVDNEPIIDSIKRKVGMRALICEVSNEGFNYDNADIYSIPVTELTLGDILLITGNYSV